MSGGIYHGIYQGMAPGFSIKNSLAPSDKIKVAVLGASGYAGGELLRLLLAHPLFDVVLAAAPSGDGRPLAHVHPSLRGLTSLPLQPLPFADGWPEVDVVCLCLPHGASAAVVPELPAHVRVLDLSGDFRLSDGEAHAAFYGFPPPPRAWQERFVYGLPELGREALASARYTANPGCFATACILALAPLVAGGLIEERVLLDAKTGSTGAGAKPSQTTHHPERAGSFCAYKSFRHQHLPEIRQALQTLSPGFGAGLVLQAHATPLVRGIFVTAYCRLLAGVTSSEVAAAFHRYYAESPFIRLGVGSPNVAWSRGSNFTDVGWEVDGAELVVFSALDNLGKGAAGQAVQNLNLMFGLPEATGLWQAGGVP